MDKVLPEQKQRRRPRLAARSRWGNVNQGWDEQSVWVKWNCWHLISFHSPLWNDLNDSRNILYILYTCRSLSLVTCGFRSLKRDPSITQTVSCESFARLRALSLNPCGFVFLHICSPARVQRETLFSRLAEGRYARVCCDCCLHYHYSFLPWNVNLMF